MTETETKIVSFAVWLECPGCKGEKQVPGGQREYGELVWCQRCDGKGSIRGEVAFADLAKLLDGLVRP